VTGYFTNVSVSSIDKRKVSIDDSSTCEKSIEFVIDVGITNQRLLGNIFSVIQINIKVS
jgi:hypothetical protein